MSFDSLFHSERMLSFVETAYRVCVPLQFYILPASSSGKYHPQFSQGEGGLVRHTKAVVMFLEELLRLSSYAYMPEDYKDYAYAAAIMHDTCKYGFGEELDKTKYADHAANAAANWEEFCEVMDYQPHPFIAMAIRAHMGQWTTNKDEKPFTIIDRVVHLADYIARRPFIDIPSIKEEKEAKS